MCGFAGFIGPSPDDPNIVIRRMTDIISHRGPDDEGYYVDGPCALGFRRLSIIDLATGHQPMSVDNGNLWIVFNGEIYNFRELRSRLEARGHSFQTTSDTEVILHAYLEWGTHCVRQFNGMFAFVIWDKLHQRLFLARDRFGVKPLYWSLYNGVLLFASEIKSILQFPGFPREINVGALDAYMSFLWTPEPYTAFAHVQKLVSAHVAIYEHGQLRTEKYWDVSFDPDSDRSERYWKDAAIERLKSSVEKRLMSEVPLGAFLSGGIDSTGIVALMNRITHRTVETYTIGYADQDSKQDIVGNDLEYARLAARELDVMHHEIMLNPGVADLLPKLIWHMDEPVGDPAAVSTYLVCREARKTLTVLLSGVGGDEVFGGYPRFVAMKLAEQYRRIPSPARHLVDAIGEQLPASRYAVFRNLKKFTRSASLDFVSRYLGYRTYFTETDKQSLYTPDYRNRLAREHSQPLKEHLDLFEKMRNADPLSQMLYVDLKTFLPSLNLMYTDKMSMATSVEVREPYLDFELVECFARMPSQFKLHGLTRKYILKKALEGIVPQKIIWRKKSGFGAPIRAWLNGALRPMVDDLLSDNVIRRRGYFEPAAIRKLIDADRSGLEYNSNHIWQLLTLELWHQTFIDRHG